jgi:hypothetical protein
MKHFELIALGSEGYRKGFKINQIYSITPQVDITSTEKLVEAGKLAFNEPYIPREQLTNMQLKSLPIGFDTGINCTYIDGPALEECLSRYKVKKTESKASKVRKQPDDDDIQNLEKISKKAKKSKKSKKDLQQ